MDRLLTSKQAAKILCMHPETLRRWEAEGRITSQRTPGGHRRFAESDVLSLKAEVDKKTPERVSRVEKENLVTSSKPKSPIRQQVEVLPEQDALVLEASLQKQPSKSAPLFKVFMTLLQIVAIFALPAALVFYCANTGTAGVWIIGLFFALGAGFVAFMLGEMFISKSSNADYIGVIKVARILACLLAVVGAGVGYNTSFTLNKQLKTSGITVLTAYSKASPERATCKQAKAGLAVKSRVFIRDLPENTNMRTIAFKGNQRQMNSFIKAEKIGIDDSIAALNAAC